MNIQLVGHEDRYAIEQLHMALFSVEDQIDSVSKLCRGSHWLTAVTEISVCGKRTRAVRRLKCEHETVRMRRQILQQSYYLAALPHLLQIPAWGALAGVRPTKISTRHLQEGGTQTSAKRLLRDVYFVQPQRCELAVDCSVSTVNAGKKIDARDVSLYVGIPFCPTRCTYCSFVSRSIGKRTELIEPYLQALMQEIELTGKLLENSGRNVRAVYVGGGTPTTLSAAQLTTLLESVGNSFDLSGCLEFTVEAGRPDTLDPQKLRALRLHGADRISINPQTMQNNILRVCGRPHTAEDVLRCYHDAAEAGFDRINMDLIAGLPQDTAEGFCRSLDRILQCEPSNITVHTLALKKGADLFERRADLPSCEEVGQMLVYAEKMLRHRHYKPYYLYRQKYMSGSFENVGWSKKGEDCLYNIYMMEETHTIVSLGGGGMTKVNFPDGTLQRFHNPKFPEQYIEQLDSVLRQKQEIVSML